MTRSNPSVRSNGPVRKISDGRPGAGQGIRYKFLLRPVYPVDSARLVHAGYHEQIADHPTSKVAAPKVDSMPCRPLLIPLIHMVIPALALVPVGTLAGQLAPSKPAGGSAEMETEIRQLLRTQADAWNDGDLETFMATYWNSPELTFSSGGQTTRGWQATLDRYRTRYANREIMGQLNFDHLEFRPLGNSATLVLGTWHLHNNQGNPQGNFSLVLQKKDGRWLIVHDHSSTLEPGADPDP